MDPQKASKSISTSTPSFSIRYNAEEEEVEQLYEPPAKLVEPHSDNNSPQSTPIVEKKSKDKSARRSGSFEDGSNDKEPWRLFTEIRGRISKRVGEKIEEIKTERLIKDKMKKEKKDKQLKTTNSLSDSEDRSEDTSLAQASSVSNASSSPEKTKSLTTPNNDESDLGDISGSDEASTPERPSTPTFTDDIVPQRPRPLGSTHQSAEPDKKDRGKSKGIKFKFIKKKVPEVTNTVEVGVDALEEEPSRGVPIRSASDALQLPKRNYSIIAHKYSWTAIAGVAALVLACFCQKPNFVSGIFVGIILAFVATLWSDRLYQWITIVDPDTNFLQGRYSFQNVPFLSDNVLQKETVPPEDKAFKGWMNEFPGEYNPQTYHISQTETVYVKLAGSILRLCTPKYKIPKRAFWTELKHKTRFTRERAFDIARCEVKLLPEGLIHKRKWSRKYPIVVYLLPNSHLGTRWAESKKHCLTDSDYCYEQSRHSPANEIHVENTKRDYLKWKITKLLRKCGKEKPEYFDGFQLEPVDSDIFKSNLEMDGLDKTPRDSPIPQTPSGGESASKKSPTGSPTHAKDVKPPSQSDQFKDKCLKSGKSSKESSPKKVVNGDGEETSTVGMGQSYTDTPAVIVNETADDEMEDDEEDDEISDYVKVSPVADKSCIILFARTAREKDLWYRRLIAATTFISKSEAADESSEKHVKQKEKRAEEMNDYLNFMKSFGQFRCSYEDEFGVVSFDNTSKERENYLWINLFIARILYDAMRQDFWIELMKNKIQKKLSVIRVPTFMEPITLAKIDFTDTVPAIEWTHNVNLNDDGIWTEVEISYQGTMTMTVDTKINLIKLKALSVRNQLPSDTPVERPAKTAYMDSSQEDSGETSTEESADKTTGANKALVMIDKFAASKVFQQVTDHRIFRKAMEGVSNTVISLNVQVKSLIGTLVLNIPPPPSDRLWYGFKPNVQIHLQAKPIVGETNINMNYITNMIEKTLRSEFQKVLVMPNMDDLVIPVMNKDMPY